MAKKNKPREVKRKVLFYHAVCKTKGKIRQRVKGRNVHDLIENAFSTEEVKVNVDEGNEIKSILYPFEDGNIVVDLMSLDDDYAFFRMGKEKDINSFQKRDFENLTPEKIELAINQYIEVYSFFILDLSNMVISLMFSQGAPGVKTFTMLLEDSFFPDNKKNKKRVGVEISMVPNDDIVSVMKKMTYFSGLDLNFAIPSKELISEITDAPVSQELFSELAELESKGISITIRGDDKKMEHQYGRIERIIKAVLKSKKDKYTDIDGTRDALKSCKITGKFGDNQRQTLDVFDEAFTWQITLKHDSGTTYIKNSHVKSKILALYESLKRDIEKRIETSNLKL